MTTPAPYRIVVGYDYSPIAELALAQAFEQASHHEHGEVHVVHVIMVSDYVGPDMPVPASTSIDEANEALTLRTSKAFEEWQKKNKKNVSRLFNHTRVESPAGEIAQVAADLDAQLVLVGTHGRRGFKRLLLGSVAEGVVRQAQCAVLVVRPQEEPDNVPKIEPPCPRCVEERTRTEGKEMWCAQHRERHGQRHTYHYESRISQDGSSSFMTGMPR